MSSPPRPRVKCRKRGGRAWHRAHFADHPLYDANDRRAFVRPGRHPTVKVWCKRHLDAYVQNILSTEAQQFQHGERAAVREPHVVATDPATWDAKNAGWNSCDPARCLVHLRDCELQPPDVRERARAQMEAQNQARRVPEDTSCNALVVRPPSPPIDDAVGAPPAPLPAPPAQLPYAPPPALQYAASPVVVHSVTYMYPPEYFAAVPQQWSLPILPQMPPMPPPGVGPGWHPAAAAHGVDMAVQGGAAHIQQVAEDDDLFFWGEEVPIARGEDEEFWEMLGLCEPEN